MTNDLRQIGRGFRLRPPWLLVLASVSLLLQMAGGRDYLAYHRLLIEQGELWRLITAHLVHLGSGHLLENLAGLALIALLCGEQFTWRQWAFVSAVTALVISLALYLFNPHIIWYVGLSGLLYGLLVAGLVAQLGQARLRGLAGVVLLLVLVKLGWEQVGGALPGSEWLTGGTVIVEAHLYGAAGGLIASLLLWTHRRWSC